jgi:N-acetylmuramoyl-L-alanine amidase
VPIGQLRNGVELPRVMGPNDRALPLIVIDAGHGGHDPGALSPGGQREKDLTLALARAARDALAATGRVRVALTRDTDRFLVLEERYGIARRLGADLFISIHCDAAANSEATGATIYTLSDVASDREAARLAARENRANMLGGIDLGGQSSDVRSILIDLTQRETMNRSVDFARTLQQVGGPHIPFRRGAHRFAGFVVLKAPDMPSILLEAGFMTNGGDVARLASATGQQALARGVTNGVLTHFARESAVRQTPIGSAGPADAAR